MKDAHGTYIRCPHCDHRIAFRIELPRRANDWSAVNWSLPNGRIAKTLGVTPSSVANARRRLAPETIGQALPQRKYDWQSVDWSQPNMNIARDLGTAESYVSSQRRRFAPIRKRAKH